MIKRKLNIFLNKSFNNFNDYSFAKRVFATDQNKYLKRLQSAGFEDKKVVFDIGAGFGQWTLVLSKICERVYAIESDKKRASFIKELCEYLNLKNVTVINDKLPELKSISIKKIDAILCFSTLMLTPWKLSINKFIKLLNDNGIAYFNFNSWGYYLKIWEEQKNMNKDYNPRKTFYNAIKNNLSYSNGRENFNGQILIEKDELVSFLKKKKLKYFKIGTEEKLFKKKENNFFKSSYKGLDTIYEVIIKN